MSDVIKKWITLKKVLSIYIAFVFVQSLFFKFTNSLETQHIFGVLGQWSGVDWFARYGAYGVGSAELVASVLLFTRYHGAGAVMALGIMTGALFFHLFTPLGITMPVFENGTVVGDDGGLLFGMACLVWLSALVLIVKDFVSSDGFLRQFRKA
jgi:hypothetical protein